MIGLYAPSVASRSGIALYGELALEMLQVAGLDATLITEHQQLDPREFDDVIYNIGGGDVDWPAFAALRLRPGPIILHEHNLTEFFCRNESQLDATLRTEVLTLIDAVDGDRSVACNGLHSWLRADRSNQYVDLRLEQIPIRLSTTVLTHSVIIAELLRQRYPTARIEALDVPISEETTQTTARRSDFGLPEDALLIGAFGFAAGNKHIETLVNAWRSLAESERPAVLLLAGPMMAKYASPGEASIRAFDYLPARRDFLSIMRLVDVGLQLRSPSLGETSATVSELLAMGTPVVVSDQSILPKWAPQELVHVAGEDHTAVGLTRLLHRLLKQDFARGPVLDALETRMRWVNTVLAAVRAATPPDREGHEINNLAPTQQ